MHRTQHPVSATRQYKCDYFHRSILVPYHFQQHQIRQSVHKDTPNFPIIYKHSCLTHSNNSNTKDLLTPSIYTKYMTLAFLPTTHAFVTLLTIRSSSILSIWPNHLNIRLSILLVFFSYSYSPSHPFIPDRRQVYVWKWEIEKERGILYTDHSPQHLIANTFSHLLSASLRPHISAP